MSVTTRADFDALLKGIYSQPLILADDDYIFEGDMPPKKYGSRVDDTVIETPEEIREREFATIRTSRRVPPGTLIVMSDALVQKATLKAPRGLSPAERAEFEKGIAIEAKKAVDEARRNLDREFRQELMGSWGDDDETPAPKKKQQAEIQTVRGKRRISFDDQ